MPAGGECPPNGGGPPEHVAVLRPRHRPRDGGGHGAAAGEEELRHRFAVEMWKFMSVHVTIIEEVEERDVTIR